MEELTGKDLGINLPKFNKGILFDKSGNISYSNINN